MAVAFIVNHPQNLTRIYLEKIGENQMLMKRMTRVMVWVLCVWLLTALMGESAIFNHSPRPALAQFPGADIVTNNALNDVGASVVTTIPLADFSADPSTSPTPLQVQYTGESTENPTGLAWHFGDEAFEELWTKMTIDADEWKRRVFHSSVVLPDGSIVLMGGSDSSGRRSDVWRSTDQGVTWTEMTSAAEWTARRNHTSVALPDGSIVLMGGNDGSDLYANDVWRSTDQGATWTQMTAAAEWAARTEHSSVALPDGSIVLMGGHGYLGGVGTIFSDVWRSTDQGVTWTSIKVGPGWSARYRHASVVLSDGTIVLMGGSWKNDVWRSIDQGATWMQMTPAAPWVGRVGHTSVALPDDSIVLMGGSDGSTSNSLKNDVWRSTDQGATWTEMTAAAEWTARSGHSSVVLQDGSIVLMGGNDGSFRNDIWLSTNLGTNWTQQLHIWTARDGHTSVALPDGSIVLMGGGVRNDVWRSTDQGATWTRMTAAASWTARSGHTSVVLQDGSIVLMGGGGRNDVWRSTDQGTTWTQMTAAAPWTVRGWHSSVALADGSIVLMGGLGDSDYYNDVWRSTDQGATWMQMTAAAGWTEREAHTSVTLPDGSIVLMGGYSFNFQIGPHRLNDVWRSTDQGATWTQMTAAAEWTEREAHTSVPLPDGSIVLMGGRDDSGRMNDVWRSTNQGATWTQMTAAAPWTARNGHSSVALPDGSIVLMGGYDGILRNDVWRLVTGIGPVPPGFMSIYLPLLVNQAP
jgi:type II secretory pathway component GspD/PulD (secretin)